MYKKQLLKLCSLIMVMSFVFLLLQAVQPVQNANASETVSASNIDASGLEQSPSDKAFKAAPLPPSLTSNGVKILVLNVNTDYNSIYDSTGYGYSKFAALLSAEGYTIEEKYLNPITLADLSAYDVVFVSYLNREITAAEAQAIATYVYEGGSLYLQSESNFYNQGYMFNSANAIADYFGIEFVPGPISDDSHYDTYSRWPLISDLHSHAITKDVTKFVMYWGVSLKVTNPTATVAAYSDSDSYLDLNFDQAYNSNETKAAYPVLAASQYGKGKVVAYGDSGFFTNNCFDNYPGHHTIARNIFSWLSIVSAPASAVTISALDANAFEQALDPGKFKVTRTGSTTSALTVKYALSGTAVNGTDYNTLSGTVIIPAGSSTATITVIPKNDTAKENNETVIATLAANSAYTIGTAKSAAVTIYDNDKTMVTISATDAVASETSPDTGTFTVTRAYMGTSSALTVNYTLSGTAVNGTDYNTLSGNVIIPAGKTTATITVTPKNDTTKESYETVIATLAASSIYNIGPAKNAAITIADNDKYLVTVTASDATAGEQGPDTGKFTVKRTYGGTASALTVNYTLIGTATNGTDYNTLSGTVTIPVGATTVTITLTPKNDTTVENNETVIVTLAASSAYNIGTAKSATVTIYDNDKTQVTIKASDSTATEAGPTTGKFTVTRAYGSTASSLTVKYTISGTATNGTDYNTLSGTVTIAAGATTATITVTPKNDSIKESSETVIATIGTSSAYNVGAAKSATVTIADND